MDIQTTKIELIKQLLNVNKESVLDKIKEILSSEDSSNEEEIVAYTANGKPLTPNQYRAEIQKGLDDIKAGRVTSDQDLAKEIESW